MLFETSISSADLYFRWVSGKFLDLDFLTQHEATGAAHDAVGERPRLVRIEQVLGIGKRHVDILLLEERAVGVGLDSADKGHGKSRGKADAEIQTSEVTIRGKTFHSDIRAVEVLSPGETPFSKLASIVVSLYDDSEIGLYCFDPNTSNFEKLAGAALPQASSTLIENHTLRSLGSGLVAGIPICGLPVFIDFAAQPVKLLQTRLAHQEGPDQPETLKGSQPKDISTPKKKGLFSGLLGTIKSAVNNTKSMLISKFRKKSTDPIDEEFQLHLDFGVEQILVLQSPKTDTAHVGHFEFLMVVQSSDIIEEYCVNARVQENTVDFTTIKLLGTASTKPKMEVKSPSAGLRETSAQYVKLPSNSPEEPKTILKIANKSVTGYLHESETNTGVELLGMPHPIEGCPIKCIIKNNSSFLVVSDLGEVWLGTLANDLMDLGTEIVELKLDLNWMKVFKLDMPVSQALQLADSSNLLLANPKHLYLTSPVKTDASAQSGHEQAQIPIWTTRSLVVSSVAL